MVKFSCNILYQTSHTHTVPYVILWDFESRDPMWIATSQHVQVPPRNGDGVTGAYAHSLVTIPG